MMLTKIDGYHAQKIRLWKNHRGPNIAKRKKYPEKWVFGRNPATQLPMVTGDPGNPGRRISAKRAFLGPFSRFELFGPCNFFKI